MTPSEYISQIDETFNHCKKNRLSRFSDEWDSFSRKINTERKEVAEKLEGNEQILLNMALLYWFEKSELLELHFKKRLFKQNLKKKLATHCNKIKSDILAEKADSTLLTKDLVSMFKRYHFNKGVKSNA